MSSKTLFDQALSAEGVSGPLADLARSVYSQESAGGKNTSTSNRDARGGMQIRPATFDSVADKGWDISDPMHNARAGIRYLKQLDKQAGGDPLLTAAGYYGGPGGLEKARRGQAVGDPQNPNYPDTLQYAKEVVSRMPGGGGAGGGDGSGKMSDGAVAPAPAVADSGGVVLPDSVLALARLKAAATPAAPGSADAWDTFLKAMPRGKSLGPADFDFLSQPVAGPIDVRPPMAATATRGAYPDFGMFRAIKARLA